MTGADVVTASAFVHRAQWKETFRLLSERPGAYFWKHVILEDVPWQVPQGQYDNIPRWFLDRYPTDFVARFDGVGCNRIKCYHDNYCQDNNDVVVNESVGACGAACKGVYEEFLQFLNERYALPDVVPKSKNDVQLMRLLDTLPVVDKTTGEEYCALELTALKTVALRPSSRWHPSDETVPPASVNKSYLLTTVMGNEAEWKLAAGLVDSPPLEWDAKKQDVHFCTKYCRRFGKLYNAAKDECYAPGGRQFLDFLLGKHVTASMYIDLAFEPPEIDEGHTVRRIPSPRNATVRVASARLLHSGRLLTAPTSRDITNTLETMDPSVLTAIEHLAVTIVEAETLARAPRIAAYLLRFFSKRVLRTLLADVGPRLGVRLIALAIRVGLIEYGLSMAASALELAASSMSMVFAVSVVTHITDIALAAYNVGGFNNELTRDMMTKQRQRLQTTFLTSMKLNEDFVVVNESYATPLVTPEFVFRLLVHRFLLEYPQHSQQVSGDCIAPSIAMELDLVHEYLAALTHNSIGQRIRSNVETTTTKPPSTTVGLVEDILFAATRSSRDHRGMRRTMQWDTVIFAGAFSFLVLSLAFLIMGKKTTVHLLLASCVLFVYWGGTSSFLTTRSLSPPSSLYRVR